MSAKYQIKKMTLQMLEMLYLGNMNQFLDDAHGDAVPVSTFSLFIIS